MENGQGWRREVVTGSGMTLKVAELSENDVLGAVKGQGQGNSCPCSTVREREREQNYGIQRRRG